jgi:hypothetical protein
LPALFASFAVSIAAAMARALDGYGPNSFMAKQSLPALLEDD